MPGSLSKTRCAETYEPLSADLLVVSEMRCVGVTTQPIPWLQQKPPAWTANARDPTQVASAISRRPRSKARSLHADLSPLNIKRIRKPCLVLHSALYSIEFHVAQAVCSQLRPFHTPDAPAIGVESLHRFSDSCPWPPSHDMSFPLRGEHRQGVPKS